MSYRFRGDGDKSFPFEVWVRACCQEEFRNLQQDNKGVKDPCSNAVHFQSIPENVVDPPQGVIDILLLHQRLAIMDKFQPGHKPVLDAGFSQLQYVNNVVRIDEQFGARQANTVFTNQRQAQEESDKGGGVDFPV